MVPLPITPPLVGGLCGFPNMAQILRWRFRQSARRRRGPTLSMFSALLRPFLDRSLHRPGNAGTGAHSSRLRWTRFRTSLRLCPSSRSGPGINFGSCNPGDPISTLIYQRGAATGNRMVNARLSMRTMPSPCAAVRPRRNGSVLRPGDAEGAA